ncbi:MAG: N(4)-(beta-N-acetylglucosaminyl)-L-asparaginase [Gemmatimonadales bacterium]|jgi:N4-(beta-N-acetylglucosaminyl)-L-asparaginase
MSTEVDRRGFVKTAVSAVAATAAATSRPDSLKAGAPAVMTQGAVQPVVISDISGIRYKNGGPLSAVEKAYQMMAQGADVLDALIAGVNIPELDPEEQGIGYGGLPNAEGVVQLDSCCIHGPKKWAGGVAALEGVRTPSLVAQAVMEYTDHHLLVGKGAQDFAKNMGFEVEADLNTEKSRELWLEWKRRVDPSHYLDPKKRSQLGYEAGLQMLREGLIEESHLWGTINCNGINAAGEICGVTTTSGLAWKIPGRTGDSPILGAGLYVDGDIGAAGSTGRGEANLFNLSSYLVVESMRRGMHPKDAGIEALQRIRSNTVEQRLLNERGLPNFNVRFFVLNARGEYAGVSMYLSGETTYAVCTESGAEERPLEGLLPGTPTD